MLFVFTFSDNHTYMMPAHFGGTEGTPIACPCGDVTAITLTYKTDQEMLSQYIPAAFIIRQPLLQITYGMSRDVPWLNGGYNYIQIEVPVTYDRAGIDGGYALVVWVNKISPLVNSREQIGIPMLFSDISDLVYNGQIWNGAASYGGTPFFHLEAEQGKAFLPAELADLNRQQGEIPLFGWRYIPNIGRPGAALNHATLFPQESAFNAAWHARGTLTWETLNPEQHPTQSHIIQALSQLPILSSFQCGINHSRKLLRIDTAQELE